MPTTTPTVPPFAAPPEEAPTPTVPRTLPRIRTILVTTDFSDAANAAIPYACALVPRGGKLRIVNVQHPRALPGGAFEQTGWSDYTREMHKQVIEGTLEQLRELTPPAAARRGVKVTHEVIEAENTARAIASTASLLDADLICLSSHGRSGLGAILLGSVAHAVLAAADRPVLVVRPDKP